METFVRLCAVGAGGFLGSVLRYLVSGWVQERSGAVAFPSGTTAVNLAGCFAIGLLSWLIETRSLFAPETRAFLLIGLLGGFTTFSTFGNETFNLLRTGRPELAMLYTGAHLIAGVGMVWLGRLAAFTIWR